MATLPELMAVQYDEMFGEPFAFGGGGEFPVKIEEMTPRAICAVFRYGKRLYNDRWNASEEKKKDESQSEYFADFIDGLGDSIGTRSGGGGGAAGFDDATQAAWDILYENWVSPSWGAKTDAQAKKEMPKKREFRKDQGSAWAKLARAYIIRALGKQGLGVKEIQAELEARMEKNLPVLVEVWAKQVEKRLQEKNRDVSFDLL